MKLKYYLRGLGIGIIATTIILMISFSMHQPVITDDEVIARAEKLGMVMKEETLLNSEASDTTETTEATLNNNTEMGDTVAPESADTQTSDTADGLTSENEPAITEENNPPAEPYILTVNSGEVCRNVCEDLQANGVVDDSEGLRSYLASVGYASSIGAGNYTIPYGLSYEEIYQILKLGPEK